MKNHNIRGFHPFKKRLLNVDAGEKNDTLAVGD